MPIGIGILPNLPGHNSAQSGSGVLCGFLLSSVVLAPMIDPYGVGGQFKLFDLRVMTLGQRLILAKAMPLSIYIYI